MSRFTSILREANERLDLPQPEKSRIILEISSDLEDTYRLFLEGGMDEEEAQRKVEEKFDFSDQALADLAMIHETPFRRLLGMVSLQAQSWWERALLIAIILFFAAYTGRKVMTGELMREAGIFIWPVATITVASFVITAWQVYRLYLKKDHCIRRLRAGLPSLVFLGGGAVLTGLLGATIDTYLTIQRIMPDMDKALSLMTGWGIRSAALMMVSLTSAILTGLAWFALMGKAASIERAEVVWLLEENTD